MYMPYTIASGSTQEVVVIRFEGVRPFPKSGWPEFVERARVLGGCSRIQFSSLGVLRLTIPDISRKQLVIDKMVGLLCAYVAPTCAPRLVDRLESSIWRVLAR